MFCVCFNDFSIGFFFPISFQYIQYVSIQVNKVNFFFFFFLEQILFPKSIAEIIMLFFIIIGNPVFTLLHVKMTSTH